jgi:hypothetical protein
MLAVLTAGLMSERQAAMPPDPLLSLASHQLRSALLNTLTMLLPKYQMLCPATQVLTMTAGLELLPNNTQLLW